MSYWTQGIGPCVGAAIARRDRALIIHDECPLHKRDGRIDRFAADAKRLFLNAIRHLIRPVVTGCSLEAGFTDEILSSRNEIKRILAAIGFGSPYLHWGSPGDSRGLFVNFDEQVVAITDYDNAEICSYPILQQPVPKRGRRHLP